MKLSTLQPGDKFRYEGHIYEVIKGRPRVPGCILAITLDLGEDDGIYDLKQDTEVERVY